MILNVISKDFVLTQERRKISNIGNRRFSGTIKLPQVPRPGMSVCVLGDQHDIDRAKHHGVDAMSSDGESQQDLPSESKKEL